MGLDEAGVRELFAADAGRAVILARREVYTAMKGGSLQPLGIQTFVEDAVAVGDGFAGWERLEDGGESIVHISADGTNRRLFDLVTSRDSDDGHAPSGWRQTAFPVLARKAHAGTRSGLEKGRLAPLDDTHFAYLTHNPYALWVLGTDGSIVKRLLRPPELGSSDPDSVSWTYVWQAREHAGRLVVQHTRTQDRREDVGFNNGRTPDRSETFFDLIDWHSGAVLKRISASGAPGTWCGFAGDAFAFVAGWAEPAVIYSTPR
jgi:hypothetical protein